MNMRPAAACAQTGAQHDRHDPAAWRDGFRAGLPTLLGIAAWGAVVGVAMVKTGLTVAQATGMTLLVYAGSAQLAALPLIAAHAPVWVIFASALAGVAVSATVAVLAHALPYKLGLLLAVVLGMLAALAARELIERGRARRG